MISRHQLKYKDWKSGGNMTQLGYAYRKLTSDVTI